MYSRRRATRYLARAAGVGANGAIASIWPLVLLLTLFSCAHRFEQIRIDNAEQTLSNAISSLCFSGEGKGRLKFQGKAVRYAFEALKRQQEWTIAFRIPFHGEEILKIEGVGSKNTMGRGDFYQQAKMNLRGAQEREELDDFIASLGNVISFEKKKTLCRITRKSEQEIKGYCGGYLWSMSPTSLSFHDNNFSLHSSDLNNRIYRKLKVVYQGRNQNLISMDLTLGDCFAELPHK